MIIRTLKDAIQHVVEQEIYENANELINFVEKVGAESHYSGLMDDLTTYDFSTPPEGFRIHQDAEGFFYAICEEDENDDDFDLEETLENSSVFHTKREAIKHAWETADQVPPINNIHQHHVVSDWLAHQLRKSDEGVAEFHGLNIWGRRTAGALKSDECIREAAEVYLKEAITLAEQCRPRIEVTVEGGVVQKVDADAACEVFVVDLDRDSDPEMSLAWYELKGDASPSPALNERLDEYPRQIRNGEIIEECVSDASKESDPDSAKFNNAIAGIQRALGQSHGDLAGRYFSDFTDSWSEKTEFERTTLLLDYVDLERSQSKD